MNEASSVCQTAEIRHRELQAEAERRRRSQQVAPRRARGMADWSAFRAAIRFACYPLRPGRVAVAFSVNAK